MITKCFVVRDAVGGSNIVTMMSAAASSTTASTPAASATSTAAAAAAAPTAAVLSNTLNVVADSTCGSEFSDSGSSSVSDDVGTGARIGTLNGGGGGRFVLRNGLGGEMHALMETDDPDDMGESHNNGPLTSPTCFKTSHFLVHSSLGPRSTVAGQIRLSGSNIITTTTTGTASSKSPTPTSLLGCVTPTPPDQVGAAGGGQQQLQVQIPQQVAVATAAAASGGDVGANIANGGNAGGGGGGRRKKPCLSARERNVRRIESNERERLRMHGLNEAFQVRTHSAAGLAGQLWHVRSVMARRRSSHRRSVRPATNVHPAFNNYLRTLDGGDRRPACQGTRGIGFMRNRPLITIGPRREYNGGLSAN